MNRDMNKASSPVALPPDLRASWQRSEAHGLHIEQALPLCPLNRADLADRLASNARLLTFSQPVIDNLLRQIGGRKATVLLTDSEGLILSASGDTGFLDRAARVALEPGAAWNEAAMGTNAIGTALATQDLAVVRGEEHYLRRNRVLSCAAIPILAPTGGVAGILDISTDAGANLQHANALLRTTAELIEHRLVESLDEGFLNVRFHPRHELLGSPLEALAVFDEGGRLIACNRNARGLLKLHRADATTRCEDCFAITWQRLCDWAALDLGTPFPLRALQGLTWAARASLRHNAPHFAHALTQSTAPLQADKERAARERERSAATANSGDVREDARIAAARRHLERWANNAGPLLIVGETGTGKHSLASRYRDEHAPRKALIHIDCRVLSAHPEPERELARIERQALEDIVYLSDIDALPVSQQARLFAAAASPLRRIIAATRCDIDMLIENHRLDINSFLANQGTEIHLPPLRERSDFEPLVLDFVRAECAPRPLEVSSAARALLRRQPWPGNLSELHNRLRLILALMGEDANQLRVEDIPEELLAGS